MGAMKAILQPGHQDIGIIIQPDRTQAMRRSRHKQGAQPGTPYRKNDRLSDTPPSSIGAVPSQDAGATSHKSDQATRTRPHKSRW